MLERIVLTTLIMLPLSSGYCQVPEPEVKPVELAARDGTEPISLKDETDVSRRTWIRQFNELIPLVNELDKWYNAGRVGFLQVELVRSKMLRLRINLASDQDEKRDLLKAYVRSLKSREEAYRLEMERPPGQTIQQGQTSLPALYAKEFTDIVMERVSVEVELETLIAEIRK